MPGASEIIFIYIPCSSLDEAKKIGRALVEERLAACANVFNGPHSIYHWEGKVEEANEALLIAKTRAAHYDRVAARARALHSYKIPCIAALPVQQLNEAYAAWILKETG
ncbi:MAG: divalent-cation tolerance protein CutA [Proteobacteria bacterium]|nr:divalent-cation tolerance protein CutA [Pseudomonadota bacterium]